MIIWKYITFLISTNLKLYKLRFFKDWLYVLNW